MKKSTEWEPSEKWLKKKKEMIASKMGHELKGYEQRLKTDQSRKKYDRSSSHSYRNRTGFWRTKIDSMGHKQGFMWAKKKAIDPTERKRKYGMNSPSFDEGVHEYKMKFKKQ